MYAPPRLLLQEVLSLNLCKLLDSATASKKKLLLLTKGSMDTSCSSVSTQDYYDQDRHQEQYHYQDDGDQEHPKETTHSESTVINLIDSLNARSWSTTRKRTFCFCDSSCLNHVNQKILERIHTMILLKSMGFAEKNISDVLRDMGNEKMKQNIEETVQQWCSTNNSDTISEESAASPTDRRKKRCTDMGVLKKSMKKKKKMDIKLKSLSELVDSKGSYVCKECNKVFDDFRALGGHTASHNRNKKAENAPSEELGTGGEDLDRSSSLAELAVDNKGKRYECDMCSRRFSTGQALGGHKSYHRKTACGEVQEVSGEGTVPAKDADLKFDLNAPPDELA